MPLPFQVIAMVPDLEYVAFGKDAVVLVVVEELLCLSDIMQGWCER
jgi:hypothetical protein